MAKRGKKELKKKVIDVAHQAHYEDLDPQPIKLMEKWLTREQFIGYLWGNVLKYIARYDGKNGFEDILKAAVYLNWLEQVLEGKEITV